MDSRSRQEALVGYLRGRASATVEEAARHFGVSVRTLHRDVAALRERDVPIEADVGRGGGLRLDPARATVSVRLTVAEVVGLVMGLSLARHAAHLPFGRAAEHALDKVIATLPAERARALQKLLRRVVVGAPASATVIATLGPVVPSVLESFEQSFSRRTGLSFAYVDREGKGSRRRVEPHGILLQVPAWYVLAYDLERDAPRMFRLDRMSRPALFEHPFEPRPLTTFDALIRDVPDQHPLR